MLRSEAQQTEQCFPWYAIKVRTRSETVAMAALCNKGYAPFFPTVVERRRYCDRMTDVPTAAFPGYIFCQLDAHKRVPVLSCPAVDYIVSLAGLPTIVSDEEIDAVRRALEAGGRPRPYLAVGQKIAIEYGALAGVEGILEHIGKQHRIVVSVHLLQRSVSLEIDEDQIRALEPVRSKIEPYGSNRSEIQTGKRSAFSS